MRLRKVRGGDATPRVVAAGHPPASRREPSSPPRDLPWESWAREERARAEYIRPVKRERFRPSLDLRVDLIRRVDRVCALQCMARSEFIEMAVERYLASWRA